ncbi:MAG: coniferyl aldehyde dehydrogenase [Balneolaceae bacterium]|nr:coniferyl aldehyde dehydrogenase [Balneolaceae bacterium]
MSNTDLTGLLERQKRAFARGAPGYRRRMDALRRLGIALEEHGERLASALDADFGGRSRDETRLLELFPLHDQIRHARLHLRSWMKGERVPGTWFLLPASARYEYQPLGVAGILGAWNYQVQLTLAPLVDALAAGNHVMLKPSEIAPRSAAEIAEMVERTFESDYVCCVTGGPDLAADFSSLSFDHLFFTGSSHIGRKVMRAASENLTPVTLEMGGKSPAIVHRSYPPDIAARRIMAGKLYNGGQTCVAPDYLLLPRGQEEAFEREARRAVSRFYPRLVDNDDYTRILGREHYDWLREGVEKARAGGARVVTLNPGKETCTPENGVFPPTLLFGSDPATVLMQEEIFGPVLPVLSYESLDEALAFINGRPHPLALYYFDRNRGRRQRVLQETRSGGVTFNDCIFHLVQHHLPFGGVGPSGMGNYHGFDGFRTFSHKRAVMHQGRFSPGALLRPPYTRLKRRLTDFLLRIAR